MFEFDSYIGNFEPKIPAVFFCRNKGDVVCDLSPEHIGRQRRPFDKSQICSYTQQRRLARCITLRKI